MNTPETQAPAAAPFAINIDPETINRMVSEAVLASAIGDQLKKAIAAEVAKLSSPYNNPIAPLISRMVSDTVVSILTETHLPEIKAQVAKQLAEKVTGDFVTKLVEAGFRNY